MSFKIKLLSTMCAQMKNNTPVMIGRGAASCDMSGGCIQSLQSWLGCLLGLVGLETPLSSYSHWVCLQRHYHNTALFGVFLKDWEVT